MNATIHGATHADGTRFNGLPHVQPPPTNPGAYPGERDQSLCEETIVIVIVFSASSLPNG